MIGYYEPHPEIKEELAYELWFDYSGICLVWEGSCIKGKGITSRERHKNTVDVHTISSLTAT